MPRESSSDTRRNAMKNVLGSKRKFRFEAEDTMKFRLVFATAALLFAALLVTTPAAQASCTAATLTGGDGFFTPRRGCPTHTPPFLPPTVFGFARFKCPGELVSPFFRTPTTSHPHDKPPC